MSKKLSSQPMRKRLLEIAEQQASLCAELIKTMLIMDSTPKVEDLVGIRKRLDAAKICVSQCRKYAYNADSRSQARAEARTAKASVKKAGV